MDSLPKIPEAALQLSRELECDEVSVKKVERIIQSDPALTASVIRVASSALYANEIGRASTVRGAVAVMGYKAVRSLALSTWLQSSFSNPSPTSKFDADRFSSNGAFCGFMARYVLSGALKRRGATSLYAPDELFACGALMHLGLGVLSFADPKISGEVHKLAKTHSVTADIAFRRRFGHGLSELGLAAAKAWKLPSSIVNMQAALAEDFGWPADELATSCLRYADYVANRLGFGLHDWSPRVELSAEDKGRVGIDESDLVEIFDLVHRQFGGRSRSLQAA